MMKGYRTVIFNAAMAVVMIIKAANPDAELPDAESVTAAVDAVELAIGLVWSIGNMLLRAITDSPIFKKE
jgi:hypothetical protein